MGFHGNRTRSPTGHLIPTHTLAALDGRGLLSPASRALLGLNDPDWHTGNPFDAPGEIHEGISQRFKDGTNGDAHGAWRRRNLQAMNRDAMGHDNELEGYRSTADRRDRGR